MVNGRFLLHSRGPFQTLHDLWDDSAEDEDNAPAALKAAMQSSRI